MRWFVAVAAFISALYCSAAPPNDLFTNRIALVGLPVQTSGSNIGAARQPDEPNFFADSAGFYATYQPVWWNWTSPTNAAISIVVAMPDRPAIIGVFTGNSLPSLIQVSQLIFHPPIQRDGTNIYITEAQFTAASGGSYAIAVDSQCVALGWDPSTNPDTVGYRLYCGNDTRTYTNTIAIGSLRQDITPELAPGLTYYFALTDFDSSGDESDFSNEVSLTVPQFPSDATGPFDLLITPRPAITIINPLSGADFIPGTSILVSVDPSDDDGTIARVEYYVDTGGDDSILLAALTSSPFSLLWTNVAPGHYSLTARLIDQFGASSASTVTITVGRPVNDDFANRLTLTGLPVVTIGYTVAAGTEPGEPPSASGSPAQHSAWWDWTAPAAATYSVVVTMPNANPSIAIYTGTSLDTLTEVPSVSEQRSSQNNGISYYATEARFEATEGTHYAIRVEGPDEPLILGITAPPSITIQSPAPESYIATGSNIVLQVDATDSDGLITNVDYFYATEAGDTVRIGAATNAPFSLPWRNSLSAGRYILTATAIDEIGATTTSAPVPITVSRPQNDDFAARTTLSALPAVTAGSNVAASKEPDESDFIDDAYAEGTVWYRWTAAGNGLYAVVVTMTDLSPVVGVFSGASFSTLTSVGSVYQVRYAESNDLFYLTVEVHFDAIEGTEYAIAVASERQPGAPFNLAITAAPQIQVITPLPNAEFAAGTNIVIEVAAIDPDRTIAQTEIAASSNDDPTRNLSAILSNGQLAFIWTNVQPGHYVLTATAFDDVDASAVSDPINFVVGRPPNDNFASRILLPGSPATAVGSNMAADREVDEPLSLGGYYSSRTVWWSWTAPSDGPKSVVVVMPELEPLVSVFTGDSLSTLSEISTLTAGDSRTADGTNYHACEARFVATAGTTYSIAVDSKTGTGTSGSLGAPFTLAITASPQIAIINPLSGADFTPGTSILVAVDPSDDDGTIARVEYYVDTGGDDSILLAALTSNPFSLLWTNALPGQYVISARVTDDSGATAFADPVTLSVGRPPNDNFADRITLSGLPVVTSGSTLAASKEAGESPEIADAPSTRSVWWSWIAPGTGADTVVVTTPNLKSLVAVYTGANISNLVEISTLKSTETTYSNGVFYYTREARFNATLGRVYAIAVDAADKPFTLAVTARPTVQIVSPVPKADFAPGSDILLQASASDPDGSVARVRYSFDAPPQTGVLIGETTNAPFSLLWKNPPIGPYSLTAKVIDNLGAITLSTPVPITVGRPANDDFAARLTLSGSSVHAFGSTVAAGVQPGEPCAPGLPGAPGLPVGGCPNSHSVWWSWTAPSSGPTTVLATMPNTRPSVAVYTGNSLPSLLEVSDLAFLDATFTNGNYYYTTKASFPATVGTTYSLLVDSGAGPPGPVELELDSPFPLQIASWEIGDGVLIMHFAANDGRRIIIEASTDLLTWQPISTNIINAGTAIFSDSSGTNFTHRFYRALLDPTLPPFAITDWGLQSDPASPPFASPTFAFTLSTDNANGAQVEIEASTNLQNWVSVATNSVSGGVFTYSDLITTNFRQRFYRALRRQ